MRREVEEGKYELNGFTIDLLEVEHKICLKIMDFRPCILLLLFIHQCKGLNECLPGNQCIVTSFMVSYVVVIWSVSLEGFICIDSFNLWKYFASLGYLMNLLKLTSLLLNHFIQLGYRRKHKLRII